VKSIVGGLNHVHTILHFAVVEAGIGNWNHCFEKFRIIFERDKQRLLFIVVLEIEDNIRAIMSIA
jgi:hypothetical protein